MIFRKFHDLLNNRFSCCVSVMFLLLICNPLPCHFSLVAITCCQRPIVSSSCVIHYIAMLFYVESVVKFSRQVRSYVSRVVSEVAVAVKLKFICRTLNSIIVADTVWSLCFPESG